MDIQLIFQVLGVIGFVSIISAILYLFTSIGKNVTKLSVVEKFPAINSLDFLLNLATGTGGNIHKFDTNNCQIFYDNDKYLQALLKDITEAKDSISLLTYAWEYDEYSKKIFDALAEAVKRGVVVRLLIDAHGSQISSSDIDKIKAEGILVSLFRPLEIGKLSIYMARVHRRAFIFDGKIGYFGGAGISKMWLSKLEETNKVFEDTMYRVTGEAVLPIASTFGELWTSGSAEVAQDLFIKESLLNDNDSKIINSFSLSHAPRIDVHPLTYAYWYSFMCAKKEIVIVSPYFVPGMVLMDILCKKALSGVKVKLIVQGTYEFGIVQFMNHSYYQRLLECGIEVYEYKKPHLHTKVTVIDNCFTICGSANFDIRSQRINHEFIFGIQSEDFAKRNLNIISSYKPNLEKIVKAEWEKRPAWKMVSERILKQFSEQF